MIRKQIFGARYAPLLLVAACFSAQVLSSEAPERKKVSTYAPAADLIEQVDVYIKQLGDSLADAVFVLRRAGGGGDVS